MSDSYEDLKCLIEAVKLEELSPKQVESLKVPMFMTIDILLDRLKTWHFEEYPDE